jgi:hypothetical protein
MAYLRIPSICMMSLIMDCILATSSTAPERLVREGSHFKIFSINLLLSVHVSGQV